MSQKCQMSWSVYSLQYSSKAVWRFEYWIQIQDWILSSILCHTCLYFLCFVFKLDETWNQDVIWAGSNVLYQRDIGSSGYKCLHQKWCAMWPECTANFRILPSKLHNFWSRNYSEDFLFSLFQHYIEYIFCLCCWWSRDKSKKSWKDD